VPSDRAPFQAGETVYVGVRPEKITIARAGDDDAVENGWNAITGLLRMSTYIGVSHQYKVEGPGGTDMTVWVQNLGADEAPRPGDRVRLSWRWEYTFAVLPQEGLSMEEDDA
jgi:spermidine/putrescine transport system ATP-binding protein